MVLNLNKSPDVPGNGFFPYQGRHGAPEKNNGADGIGRQDKRSMAHQFFSLRSSRTQPLRLSCSSRVTRARVSRLAA